MPTTGIALSTYLEPHDADRLRQCAKAADRSLAGEIRHAIRQHLNVSSTSGAAPAGGSAEDRADGARYALSG
jgi:hypothetical protein